MGHKLEQKLGQKFVQTLEGNLVVFKDVDTRIWKRKFVSAQNWGSNKFVTQGRGDLKIRGDCHGDEAMGI